MTTGIVNCDAIAPHVRAIADYLYDDFKDYRDSGPRRRAKHIWRSVAALLAAIGVPEVEPDYWEDGGYEDEDGNISEILMNTDQD